jgi:DNA topoisomerase I
LAVPPAWRDVWICADPNGHLQATGRDARGRKQYRYHRDWRAYRDQTKFDRMVPFGRALPAIRHRVHEDLRRPGLPRERVLAVVIDLLDRTLIRVGNDEYARENGSFGLTTLQDNHVDVDGSELRFTFVGKGGKEHAVGLRDRRLASVVERIQDLPGHRLFQYVDDDGVARPVDSEDVNEYLRAVAGEDFSAKDFRTWGATAHVTERLLGSEAFDKPSDAEGIAADAIRSAARRLGNTVAVTRASYVHPAVVPAFVDGTLQATWSRASRSLKEWPEGLSRQEAMLLAVLSRSPTASNEHRRRTKRAKERDKRRRARRRVA